MEKMIITKMAVSLLDLHGKQKHLLMFIDAVFFVYDIYTNINNYYMVLCIDLLSIIRTTYFITF